MIIIIVAVITIAGYIIQSQIYERQCFKNVHIKFAFKDNGMFKGDSTELYETVENRKILPLWWVTSSFRLSKNIEILNHKEGNNIKADYNYRKDLFSAGSYQRVKRTFDVKALRRGYYTIDDAGLVSGDIFGNYKYTVQMPVFAELYVYPCSVMGGKMQIPFERLMCDINTKLRILEDPFLIRGIRDYNGYDSMKRINWCATARTGELKVNEYDFTVSERVIILLNFDKRDEWDGDNIMEESISIAASVADECISRGIAAGMTTNGINVLTGEPVCVEVSNAPDHMMSFFKNMAVIDTQKTSCRFSKILDSDNNKRESSDLYILISEYTGEDIQKSVKNFRISGGNLYWVVPSIKGSRNNIDMKDVFIWEVSE